MGTGTTILCTLSIEDPVQTATGVAFILISRFRHDLMDVIIPDTSWFTGEGDMPVEMACHLGPDH